MILVFNISETGDGYPAPTNSLIKGGLHGKYDGK